MARWRGIDPLKEVITRKEASVAYPWLTIDWVEDQSDDDFFFVWSEDGLHLKATRFSHRSSLHIDFLSGNQARRIKSLSGESLTRAIGCHKGLRPSVIDATAGLGSDMSVLANFGCSINAFERHPVIAALLADAIGRAGKASVSWVDRVVLHHKSATDYLGQISHGVIYLDPMFPEERKASPSLAMQIFQALSIATEGHNELFEAAMDSACSRLVVKRPLKASPFAGRRPVSQITGKTVRFDLYPKCKLTESDCEPHEIKLCQ